MKNITDFINEQLGMFNEEFVYEGEISSADDFKAYAEKKFKKVFGDDLDEDKMNSVVNGILKKYKSDADNGDWGKLVGVLNKSF